MAGEAVGGCPGSRLEGCGLRVQAQGGDMGSEDWIGVILWS